jgi:hypothetical protein
MMTKRQFEKIADILGSASPDLNSVPYTVLCDKIAALCEEENPRFNRARFWDAINARAIDVAKGRE